MTGGQKEEIQTEAMAQPWGEAEEGKAWLLSLGICPQMGSLWHTGLTLPPMDVPVRDTHNRHSQHTWMHTRQALVGMHLWCECTSGTCPCLWHRHTPVALALLQHGHAWGLHTPIAWTYQGYGQPYDMHTYMALACLWQGHTYDMHMPMTCIHPWNTYTYSMGILEAGTPMAYTHLSHRHIYGTHTPL